MNNCFKPQISLRRLSPRSKRLQSPLLLPLAVALGLPFFGLGCDAAPPASSSALPSAASTPAAPGLDRAQKPAEHSSVAPSADAAPAKTRAQANSPRLTGVRVTVAGTQSCRSCSLDKLEARLGARARPPLPKDPLTLPDDLRSAGDMRSLQQNFRWAVKFRDDLRVRLAPPEEHGQTPGQAPADTPLQSRRGQDLASVEALRQRYRARFVRSIQMTDAEMRELQERALRRTLRAQPDLGGLYWIDATFDSPEQMLRFGQELQALDEVEYVELEALNVPPPMDIPPKTDDLSGKQGHLGPDPGVNGTYAWKQGYFGQGVRVSDCEYAWHVKHEDLSGNPIGVEKGVPMGTHDHNHGTAVMGVVVAGHNGYGVKGLAPKAKPFVYPETNRRAQAIASAARESKAGDIVMLEMQTYGYAKKLVPAEYDKSVWMVTKTGTDAGVLIIAAAGNGSVNLDTSHYKSYLSRGDSGAIIIGAGRASKSHSRMGFSTYGKRVDVQGWGEKVVTTGYGDLKKYGGDKNQQYTRRFSGTSSATPVVSGAAALIQSYAKEKLGKALSPVEMRTLLKETGIPQTGGGNIGPFPNVKAAFEKLGNKGPADKEAPKVKITKPAEDIEHTLDDDEKSYELKIEVDASDDTRVKEVYLEVDGKKVGDADDSEPYIFEVELEAGSYKIVAVAVDPSKNEGRSKALKALIESGEGNGDDSSSDDTSSDPESTSSSGEDKDDDSDDPGEDEDKNTGKAKDSSKESDDDDADTNDDDDDATSSQGNDNKNPSAKPPKPPRKGCALATSLEPSPLGALGLWFLLVAGRSQLSRRSS